MFMTPCVCVCVCVSSYFFLLSIRRSVDPSLIQSNRPEKWTWLAVDAHLFTGSEMTATLIFLSFVDEVNMTSSSSFGVIELIYRNYPSSIGTETFPISVYVERQTKRISFDLSIGEYIFPFSTVSFVCLCFPCCPLIQCRSTYSIVWKKKEK
jgi:hypothetical protein